LHLVGLTFTDFSLLQVSRLPLGST